MADNAEPLSARQITELLIERYSAGRDAEARELYDDEIVVPVPLEVPEPLVLEGKASVAAAADAARERRGGRPARMMEDLEVQDLRFHDTSDPDVCIAEFTWVSRIGESTVQLPTVVIIECRDGKAVRTRGYQNPAMAAVANGEVDEFIERLRAAVLPEDRQ